MPAADPLTDRRLFWPLLAGSVAYSMVLVWATHHPKPEDLLGPKAPPDKMLHFAAYGVLGLLVAATLATSGRCSRRNVVVMAVSLAVAAMLDEATQPMFGRAAEALDWVYDCIGLIAGIAALAALRHMLHRPSTDAS